MKASIKYLRTIVCICMSVCLLSCGESEVINDVPLGYCDVFLCDRSGNSLLESNAEGALDTDKISVITDEIGLIRTNVAKFPENTTTCLSVEFHINKEDTFEFTIDWGNGWQDTIFMDYRGKKIKAYVNGEAHSFVRDGWREIRLVRD